MKKENLKKEKIMKNKFKKEYGAGLSEKWDEIINWEKREESEKGFFEKILQEHGAKKVLDMACGTGFHAVNLAKAGFDVTATDGSEDMLAVTEENAQKYGVDLKIDQADWLQLSKNVEEKFDAVVCLGNALTHLFYDDYYKKAIKEVSKVLKDGGIFIVDQRNYDALLDVGYDSKHKYYYCGDKVEVKPIIMTDDLAKFEYKFSPEEKYYLSMHPIRKAKMSTLLLNSGFSHEETYGDFEKDYEKYEADFIVHVAHK